MAIRIDGLPSGVRPKEMRLTATILRADGRREPLGTVAYWHRNPALRALWVIRRFAAHVRERAMAHARAIFNVRGLSWPR